MPNKTKNDTAEEREIGNGIDIKQQYDYDVIVGNTFLKTLPDILNKRYHDGWRYIKVFKIGNDEKHLPVEPIFGILYENIIQEKVKKSDDLLSISLKNDRLKVKKSPKKDKKSSEKDEKPK